MQNRIGRHIRSNVVAFAALFFTLTGGAYALDGPLPGQNQVGSDDIINGEVKNGDIGTSEVKANNVAPDSLGGNKIVDRSVKNADLGLGASSSNTIADHGIQGIDVMNNTLTGTQIDESTLAGLWKLGGNSGTGASDFLGTSDNNPLNLRVNGARGLRLEPASDGTNQSPNVIGGIADNAVTPGVYAGTIAGGGRSDPFDSGTANKVTENYGTVGGGARNQAGDDAGAVDGAQFATVGGGRFNTAAGENATVSGGGLNNATGFMSSVGGGQGNTASGFWATVPGGSSNTAQGFYSLAGGNGAQANHDGAFVWADSNNLPFPSTGNNQFSVRSTGGARLVSGVNGSGSPTSGLELPAGGSGWSTLVSGQPFDLSVNGARGLRIDPASDGTSQSPNVIGGTADNSVTPGVHSAVIGGGGRGTPSNPATANRVTDHQGTVGGGANNQAGDDAGNVGDATLGTVGGGGNNVASGEAATVGGGFFDHATGPRATVAGGEDNTASGDRATVGGGDANTASGTLATVAGGNQNHATAEEATVGGGASNTASELDATVGGGFDNQATGLGATVPGGFTNTAQGNASLAAGTNARALHNGAFVWADATGHQFDSTVANQFSVRSVGGARFVSGIDPTTGAPTAGVELAPGGGSWSTLSDRASKRAIEPVAGREVLRKLATVPVSTWSYRAQDRSIRHIGPMAQDFYRALGVGEDRRHIASVDADGVALAAIKGLSRELRAERRRRHQQERRMDRLEARLAALERGGGR